MISKKASQKEASKLKRVGHPTARPSAPNHLKDRNEQSLIRAVSRPETRQVKRQTRARSHRRVTVTDQVTAHTASCHRHSMHLRPRDSNKSHESPERFFQRQKDREKRLILLADPQTGVDPGWTRVRHMRSRCRCSMCSAIHINSRS